MAKQWAQTDRESALNYVVNAPETGQEKAEMIGDAVEDWASQDPQAVLRWAAGQKGEVQEGAQTTAANKWAEQDPAGLAAWAAQMPASDARATVWRMASASWSAQDPVAAERWLDALPAGPERDTAAEFYSLGTEDRASVEPWLGSLPAGFGRDVAIAKYASRPPTTSAEYTASADWIKRIGDEKLRNDSLVVLVNRWLEKDAPQAKQWLAQGNLPSELAGKIKGQ